MGVVGGGDNAPAPLSAFGPPPRQQTAESGVDTGHGGAPVVGAKPAVMVAQVRFGEPGDQHIRVMARQEMFQHQSCQIFAFDNMRKVAFGHRAETRLNTGVVGGRAGDMGAMDRIGGLAARGGTQIQ